MPATVLNCCRRTPKRICGSRTLAQAVLSPKCSPAIKPFDQIPGPWPSLPLIGTNWQYFNFVGRYKLFKLHEANLDKYHRYGPIVREEFDRQNPVIHLFDPNDFEKVFRSQGKYPNRPPSEFVRHYRSQRPDRYPTMGLAHLQGEEWYLERKQLAPALLKLDVIPNHIRSLNDICDDFVTYLESACDTENVVNDLQEAAYRLALESICMMSLDSRMGCLSLTKPTSDGESLIAATKLLFESYQELYYGSPIWKLIPTKEYKKFTQAEDKIYDTASKYLDKAFTHYHSSRAQSSTSVSGTCPVQQQLQQQQAVTATAKSIAAAADPGTSILETLLDLGIDQRKIKITILDFISGGIFTVSNTLAYLLFNLASNAEVQEKLYQELRQIVGHDSHISAEHLSKMTYLKACVKESFRLSSTVPSVVRILPEDTILSGYQIPAGTTVFSHFLVTCQLEKYFENPKKFQPERWLAKSPSGGGGQKSHPFALLPFGFGNRMCTGRRFSELELYLSTAKVILRHRLEATSAELDLTHAFIVIPAEPIEIKMFSRSS